VNELNNGKTVKLIVDVEDIANELELMFGADLLPAPKGIYSITDIDPVMVDGVRYLTRVTVGKKNGPLVEFTDIDKLTTPVYNEAGECIISQITIDNKDRLLSNRPLRPYRGIKIARILFDRKIDETIAWRKRAGNHFVKIKQHLLPDTWLDEELEQYLLQFTMRLNETLGELMLRHEWNVYFITQRGSKLTIERGEDYRVIEWTRLNEEGKVKL
jgi:hypothetical protein